MPKALTAVAVEKVKSDPARRLEIPDGLLPGLYLVVQTSGARSWAVRYRAAGRTRKLTLGTYPALQLGDARDAARDALKAASRGADPAADKRTARSHASETTFGAVARRYLARDAKQNRSWRETARLIGLGAGDDDGRDDPETFIAIKGTIAAAWATRQLSEIRRSEILEKIDAIVDRGSGISANRTLAALRRLFNWSVERGLIDASPAVAIKAPAPEVSRDRVLTDDEIRWFWLAATEIGYPFGTIGKLLLATGQRREEVAGMGRREIEGSVWTIPASRAKNDLLHMVPLPPLAFGVLADVPEDRADLLFTTTGDTPVSGWSRAKSNLDAAMLRIARKETGDDELTIPNWTLHDLRRTFASGAARLGIAVHVVERMLNHGTGTIRGVAAVYNRHDYWAERVGAGAAWGEYLTKIAADK